MVAGRRGFHYVTFGSGIPGTYGVRFVEGDSVGYLIQKSRILFFHGITQLVPEYMKERAEQIDRIACYRYPVGLRHAGSAVDFDTFRSG
jgi:hypothetical protein